MTTSPFHPAPMVTPKAERKAAVVAANDSKVFEQTQFGRRRVPVRFGRLVAMLAIVAVPVAYIFRKFRGIRGER